MGYNGFIIGGKMKPLTITKLCIGNFFFTIALLGIYLLVGHNVVIELMLMGLLSLTAILVFTQIIVREVYLHLTHQQFKAFFELECIDEYKQSYQQDKQ